MQRPQAVGRAVEAAIVQRREIKVNLGIGIVNRAGWERRDREQGPCEGDESARRPRWKADSWHKDGVDADRYGAAATAS